MAASVSVTPPVRPLSAEQLVRNVSNKLSKAGMDVTKYSRQLKDIAALFEPERSCLQKSPSGAWDMVCYIKGIRHCFHSAREVAATFGIPVARGGGAKRRRDQDVAGGQAWPSDVVAPGSGQGGADTAADTTMDHALRFAKGAIPSAPLDAKKQRLAPAPAASKKTTRVGGRFQNGRLVQAINAHVGRQVSCGDLVARLVSANLGGMLFELLDAQLQPTGDIIPPSQLAKRSSLAHQNNAWKSIKVDGVTLDTWVCRLQDEINTADGTAGTLESGQVQAAMYMHAVDTNQRGGTSARRGPDDDVLVTDESEGGDDNDDHDDGGYGVGAESSSMGAPVAGTVGTPGGNGGADTDAMIGGGAGTADPASFRAPLVSSVVAGEQRLERAGGGGSSGIGVGVGMMSAAALRGVHSSHAGTPLAGPASPAHITYTESLGLQLAKAHEALSAVREENRSLRGLCDHLERTAASRHMGGARPATAMASAQRGVVGGMPPSDADAVRRSRSHDCAPLRLSLRVVDTSGEDMVPASELVESQARVAQLQGQLSKVTGTLAHLSSVLGQLAAECSEA